MSDPLVECRDLGRRTPDGRWLLEGAALRLAAGSRTAISGPSGSGKSLLLRAIALLDPAEAGEVLCRGETIANQDVPRYRAEVMYVPQRPTLLEGSVEDNLRLPFELAVRRNQKFDRASYQTPLKRLGRDDGFLDKSVGDLSGGERQLVVLLRTLALEPTVLLLDEPTAALDPKTRDAAESLLGDWLRQRSERAFLWVTHDADQAGRVGDTQLTMEGGRLRD